MSGLDVSSLGKFAKALRGMNIFTAHRAAAIAAPGLTAEARKTFDAGENAYGNTWTPLATGDKATLNKSGALAAGLVYVAIGRVLRVRLPVAYARYQIGRRPVHPSPGSPLPPSFVAVLKSAVAQAIAEEVGT